MPEAFTTRGIVGVGTGAFLGILFFGLLAGAGAFLWTIDNAPDSEFRSRDRGRASDPDPAFGQKIRQMYALDADAEVVRACANRRAEVPQDPEGYLYAALALERLGARPGLDAMEYRAAAKDMWARLYDLATNYDTTIFGNRLYNKGWALMGLGRPTEAIETFGRHLREVQSRGVGLDFYNRACYYAIAGETEAAQRALMQAMRHQRGLQRGWAEADPDLESLHGTLPFEVWTTYRRLLDSRTWRRYSRQTDTTLPRVFQSEG